MTGTQSLLARAVLGAVAAAGSVLLASSARLLAMPGKSFDRTLLAAMAASRVILFVLLFLVLGVAPRGDVQAFYLPQAEAVLLHRLPYRDFLSSYGPLHPYLDALFIRLAHTSLAIMLASVLAELLLLPLWLRVGRTFVPEPQLRTAALLYLASPLSLQFVTVDGQDNVLIAVLIALSLLLLRHRALLSGIVFAASITAIKFLPLLYTPAFIVAVKPRIRWVAGVALVLAAFYGGFLLFHTPILQPLLAESGMHSASNLPYLIETLFAVSLPNRLLDAALALILIAVVARIALTCRNASTTARMNTLTYGLAALTLALLLFAKKSWPPYLMMSLFPICLLPAAQGSKRPAWGSPCSPFSASSPSPSTASGPPSSMSAPRRTCITCFSHAIPSPCSSFSLRWSFSSATPGSSTKPSVTSPTPLNSRTKPALLRRLRRDIDSHSSVRYC